MDINLGIVGLVRFSVLTPTYFSERFATLEAAAAHLFSPERMELRFRVFERLCLPSLLRQSDQGFQLIVLTAEDLPLVYLERLAALLEPVQNITLIPVGAGAHYNMIKRGYNAVPTDDVTHRVLFRLDDDDAIDLDYVARSRRLAMGLIPLQGEDTPFILANNRGFYLRKTYGPHGLQDEIFDACEKAPLSVGVALVAPVSYGANPYRYNHRRYAQHWNTVSDISTPGFLRTIHGDNMSQPTQMGITHKMMDADIASALKQHFGITPDQLRAVLP
ncbi:glycosyltransferase [Phaeobacter sp. C3_T13_0]|uniref:glycosyltransferase n=1 Tax=Phaeobacter cretensis TaxID=3342641 RepID=UPI0039BD27F0